MKTITYDETKWRLVPVEPTPEMLDAWAELAMKRILGKRDGKGIIHAAGENWKAMLAAAPQPPAEASGMKLLGYANAFCIKQTCADKPGGAHLGQVAIYAGESVDPMEIQARENPTFMGEPDNQPLCYSCGCRSDNDRNWQGRAICSKCRPSTPDALNGTEG